MKYIISIIKPHRLEEVRTALSAIGVEGMTVSEVKGHGRQKGHTEIYRGAEYEVSYLPKIKIELALEDKLAAKAVDTITESGRTGQIGDGNSAVILQQIDDFAVNGIHGRGFYGPWSINAGKSESSSRRFPARWTHVDSAYRTDRRTRCRCPDRAHLDDRCRCRRPTRTAGRSSGRSRRGRW